MKKFIVLLTSFLAAALSGFSQTAYNQADSNRGGGFLPDDSASRPSDFPDSSQTVDSSRTVDSARPATDRFALYYWCDRIDLDENYLDNAAQMAHIRRYLAESPRIDSIAIYAYASPEGVYERNRWLSERRAEAAKRYILSNLPAGSGFDESVIRLYPMAENWAGLREELEAGYHRADREQVLAILDADVRDDTKKWRLQQLDHGLTYKYIIRNHMPRLRMATWICVWVRPEAESPVGKQPDMAVLPLQPVRYSAVSLPQPQPVAAAQEYDKRTIVALKSNLLYDVVSVLNFAVEFPITERFSVLYEHHCPWWLARSNKYCLEFLSFGGEFRWWFRPQTRPASERLVKRDALMGHFLGLYGWGGKFDFQRKRSACYQGEFFSAGVTYGYSMPVAKRLNLEFSLSVGYASIPYRHYVPSDDWELLIRDRNKVGTWHYFGPTKAEVSLAVPLLIRYKKKGGDR